MFSAKAHSPNVLDFNPVGVRAACCHPTRVGLIRFVVILWLTPPTNGIAQSQLCSTNSIVMTRASILSKISKGIEGLTDEKQIPTYSVAHAIPKAVSP